MLEINTTAPDFELQAGPDQKMSLRECRGKNVILAFYPADWSPVYWEALKDFDKYDAVILGISVDSKWCRAAFHDARNLYFTLLADFEPKGAVAKKTRGL